MASTDRAAGERSDPVGEYGEDSDTVGQFRDDGDAQQEAEDRHDPVGQLLPLHLGTL